MVADFISTDYGWLRSPDGTDTARVLLRLGAYHDGYFTHNDVIAQATKAGCSDWLIIDEELIMIDCCGDEGHGNSIKVLSYRPALLHF